MPGNGNVGNNGNGNSQGPPDHANGRGPPDHVRKKFKRSKRQDDGTIQVSDDPVEDLASNINWDNLSPFEEWVVAILSDEELI